MRTTQWGTREDFTLMAKYFCLAAAIVAKITSITVGISME